jgi:FKBP-type peptidyl-prolyl cis-trans isomerase FklB
MIPMAKGRVKWFLPFYLLAFLPFLAACSESDEDASDEFGNWQQRNEAFFSTLEDSLSRGGATWKKLKSYTKVPTTSGAATEYVYARVIESGSSAVSAMFTDTVRVSYRGRLIPTASYPQGYVFDQTYTGAFSWQTTAVSQGAVSGFVDGFTTALLHMHPGDRWRVYIPYQLGYNASASGSIPAYSTLTFDIALKEVVRRNME